MKKYISMPVVATMVAALSLVLGSGAQADPLDKVVGYDKMGGTEVSVSAVGADGTYTITLARLEGVAFKSKIGSLTPTAGPLNDKPTQQSVWIYAIPDGSMVYAMGLGGQWGDMSKEVDELDINKARAQATITGGKVSVAFVKNADPKKACEMVNWVVVTPGGRMWGAHPLEPSPWVVPNVNGSPRTGWCVQGSQIVTVDKFDPKIRAALKAKP